jgi:UDPglucose--hexose-1-phosphate uridylyltransferase
MDSGKEKKQVSELRMDLVSNDWIVVATGRGRRPETFAKQERTKEETPIEKCPFCKEGILDKAIFRKGNVISIPNDFPAFSYGESLNERMDGPNRIMDGVGFQEVIITLDHKKHLAQFSKEEMRDVIDVYQARYLDLIEKKFIKYVSIFHNHGKEAGASVAHPHSQLIAIPIIDPDLRDSMQGASAFYEKTGKCVYCAILDWDMKDGQRVIYENEKFVALCPFAPQSVFEVRVYPKKHQPYFERITEEEKDYFADALRMALSKIYKGLNDPAYNFYIHTAPRDNEENEHYHWHLVILPKTSIWAGFELAVGIEISTIEPEKAAEFLRGF